MNWRYTIIDRTDTSTEIDEPVGWDANTCEIKRDPDYHGIVFTSQGDTFQFSGLALDIIKTEYEAYGAEGILFLVLEEDCGQGFIEFSRGKFLFAKYEFICGDECFVRIPVENINEVMNLRNKINQGVNLDSLIAFDEVTALDPYDKLSFPLLLPSKGIFMQNKAEFKTEAITTVNLSQVPDIKYDTAPSNYNTAFFQITPQFDNVIFSEFGRFTTAITPENEFSKSGFYPTTIDPTLAMVVNGMDSTPPDIRKIYFDWITASPLLVNEGGLQNFDSIEKFSFSQNYSFEIEIIHGWILALYNVVIIRRAAGTFEYLITNRLISPAYGGGPGGFNSGTIWLPGNTYPVSFTSTHNDIVLGDGDYLFTVVCGNMIYINTSATAGLDAFKIRSISGSVQMETISHLKPSEHKVFAINEAISRVAESLTNNRLKLYSDYFGRTDSQPYQAPADGCGSLAVITDGIRIRGQESKIPDKPAVYSVSLQDIFDGLNPIFNIGFGLEPDPARAGFNRLRVENWKFFYNDTLIFSCPDVGKITHKCYEKEIFSTFQFGFAKWEAEEYTGLDEFLTKRSYRTTISSVKNDLVKYSKFIASGYALEVTRRKGKNNSKDWKYDKDTFIICCKRETGELAVELGNVSLPENIVDPDTLYNYRISPVRNALRWMNNVLRSYRVFDNSAKIIFTDGDGNYFAKGIQADGCRLESPPLTENQTIDPGSFADDADARPFLLPERITFDYPMLSADYKALEGNPYGKIFYSNECESGYGFIDSINYRPEDSIATFVLIPATDPTISGCVAVAILGAATLPAGLVGTPYFFTVALYGSQPFDLQSIVKPAWLEIVLSGSTIFFTGTPDELADTIETVSFDIQNCSGSNSALFDTTIDITLPVCVPVGLDDSPLPDGYTSTTYNYTIALSGDGPFVLGSIIKPAWMNISLVEIAGAFSIVFSGIPTADATDLPVSFTVTNCAGINTATIDDTIDITTVCVPVGIIGPGLLPDGILDAPYAFTIALSGTLPFTLSSIVAPSWLTIAVDGSDIIFSGTPDVEDLAIDVSFTVENCTSDTVDFSDAIDVNGAPGPPTLLQTNHIDNVLQTLLDLVDSDTVKFEYLGAGKVTAKSAGALYFASGISLIADTPYTVNHALALADKGAFIADFKVGDITADVVLEAIDINNLTITSNIDITGSITIVGRRF